MKLFGHRSYDVLAARVVRALGDRRPARPGVPHPPFTDVITAMFDVVTSSRFVEAGTITLQAFVIGMALAPTAGIGIGFLMGRVRAIGQLMGMWVNIFESSPMTAIVPALMALLGFGLPTMVVTVFIFSVWVIALDTQVGVERVNTPGSPIPAAVFATTPKSMTPASVSSWVECRAPPVRAGR